MNYLLIWDIDGTLIHSKSGGRKTMNDVFLSLYQISAAFDSIDMAGSLDTNIALEAFKNHALNPLEIPGFFDAYCEILLDQLKALGTSLMIPFVAPLLKQLQSEKHLFHALGTGNIEKGARIKLSIDNLNQFFPVGGFSNESHERWQVIKKASENAKAFYQQAFDEKNTFVIGDTPKDIACGKKMNFKTIGVATGGYSVQELMDCGADHVLPNFEDIDFFLSFFK